MKRWRKKATIAALVAAGLFGLGCAVGGDVVAYDVPAESARYTFESETNGVKTVWEYTSDRPAKGDAPEQQPCMGAAIGITEGECRPEPLIFLRYDLGLALDNTAKANGSHVITVTGYYQERLSTPPKVTALKVEASFDGGQTWQPAATVAAGSPNTYTSEINHPGRERVDGAVSLRITAADDRGNTVTQTMPSAYRLS
ncbi:MAG TPA: hypothetical protein VF062_00625 [Candidatus Limnocylindrales bacterium]